jgi:hypothetical protein
MTKTEILAWWGAVLSTLVFLWDIYKWRTQGPKMRMSVQSGMESINMPNLDGKKLFIINVTNYGDRSTTITNTGLLHYTSIWAYIRNRPNKMFVMPQPSTAQPIPFELKQGNVWTGIGIQDEKLEEVAKHGYLFCVVYHSHCERPLKRRVIIRKRSNAARAI